MDKLLQELQEDNKCQSNKLWPNDSRPNKLWQTIKKLKLFSGSFDTTGVFKLGSIATFEFSAKLTIGKK